MTSKASKTTAPLATDPALTATAPGLRITAKQDGFRRAGRAWSRQPIDIIAADLSDEQVAMLRAEAMLVVADIDITI